MRCCEGSSEVVDEFLGMAHRADRPFFFIRKMNNRVLSKLVELMTKAW